MHRLAIVLAFATVATSASAQWLKAPTPGAPRDAAGKINMTATAPRSADGHPDLSGLWQLGVDIGYAANITADLPESSIQASARALSRLRLEDFGKDDPEITGCKPGGPRHITRGGLTQIIQTPQLIVLLFEVLSYRQIFMDGRALPDDPNPTWMGYSVGHWDGDALVVESAGFNDRTWLDRAGHPHSEKLRVTERFRRVDFGHIQFQITFDDPETLTKPLTFSLSVNYTADTDMLENVCNEGGNRDRAHLVGTERRPVPVTAAVLEKYTGTYVFREGPRIIASFMGMTQKVTLVNEQLYLNALPLIPESQTKFESTGADAEFFLDANGKVTRLVLRQTQGDAIYVPKPPDTPRQETEEKCLPRIGAS